MLSCSRVGRRHAAIAVGICAVLFAAPSEAPPFSPSRALAFSITLSSAASCGCPPMPVVATSSAPAKGAVYQELRTTDLEAIFSNRHILYPGDWDDAFVALAHEVDPSGTLKIWTRPVPQPVRQAPLVEGGLTFALLNPDRFKVGTVPRPVPIGSNPWGYQYSARSVMFALVNTLARINKYGEPASGLRAATLRAARFLVDDLHQIPLQVMKTEPRGLFVSAQSADARGYLAGAIDISEQTARNPQLAGQRSGDLPLDAFDVANAALDVLWSADSSGRQTMMQTSIAGDTGVIGNGLGGGLSVLEHLLPTASASNQFGGAAPAGSKYDAVACRAFSTLVTFADSGHPGAKPYRDRIFGEFMDGLRDLDQSPQGASRVNMARGAWIRTGFESPSEAAADVDTLFSAFSSGPYNGQDRQRDEIVTTLSALSRGAGGPGRDTYRQVVADRIAHELDVRRRSIDVHVNGADPGNFVDRWARGGAQVIPASIGGPCGVGPGPQKPHIFLYAICANGLQVVKELYIGVPTIIEAQFDPPSGDAEITLDVSIGGHVQKVKVRRYDPEGYIYRSDPILPTEAGR